MVSTDSSSGRLLTFDLHRDLIEPPFTHNLNNYQVFITGKDEKLLLEGNTLLWIRGGVLSRRLTYDSNIINCFFTTFNEEFRNDNNPNVFNDSPNSKKSSRHLIVALKDQIYVYEPKGRSQLVSFPFRIRNAFPFENGIVISRELEGSTSFFQSSSQQQQSITPGSPSPYNFGTSSSAASGASSGSFSLLSNESNFLTLKDPLGELGSIVSSSTTSFSSKEELVLFPKSSEYSIAATLNQSEHKLIIYHTRFLSKSKFSKTKPLSYQNLRRTSKRTTSGSGTINTATPSISRIMDDNSGNESKSYRASSTSLSYDRMVSGGEFNPDTSSINTPSLDVVKLRKDVIFTKLSSVKFKNDIKYLKMFNISYNDQESVIICNLKTKVIEFLVFNNSISPVSLPTLKTRYVLQGLDCTALNNPSGHKGYVLLLQDNYHIVLVNPFLGIISPNIDLTHNFPPIVSLDDSFGCDLSVFSSNFKHYTINLALKPSNNLVNIMLNSLKYLSNYYIYEYFWLQWCSNLTLKIPGNNDWKAFVVTFLSLTIPSNANFDNSMLHFNSITELIEYAQFARQRNEAADSSNGAALGHYSLEELTPTLVLALHLIREDVRLNVLNSGIENDLSLLLAQMVTWMGWSEGWVKYYMQDPKCLDKTTRFLMAQQLTDPPNLFQSLSSLFTSKIVPYITFSQVSEEDESVDLTITPRTYYVLRLFEVIVSPEYESIDVLRMMVDYNIKNSDLDTYPLGIYLPLKNAIMFRRKEVRSQSNCSSEELELIGRKDLLLLSDSLNGVPMIAKHKRIDQHQHLSAQHKSMDQILKNVDANEVMTAWDEHAEADKFHVTKLIFCEDRRFYELSKILQTSKVQTATLRITAGLTEEEKLDQERALGAKVALRTLTMPLGRGAVFISSRKPLMSERFPIPKINFNSLILPDMINVSLEKDALDQNLYDWGYFHNGCSSGLMISRDSTEVNGSWIVFNKPPSLNPQHAGFLLGLGLNGHLKKLEEWHIYNYLGPKHNFTSVGLLLGMAASLRGTMDIKLTKVLSVHVVALLPPGSTNLNVQLPVQTAGLVGIGLLYLGTQHRKMTEVVLSQIGSTLTLNEREVVNEGYRLAAGIALGYINLGKGNSLKNTNATHVLDQLYSMAVSLRDVQSTAEYDKSVAGSLMGLMFMFMKTNDSEAASKLSIPNTSQLLEYARPDFWMLRALARNIITWDSIEPTQDWIHQQLPKSLESMIASRDPLNSDFLSIYNILGGLLLSIGIRFASTGNLQAKSLLIYYLEEFMKLSDIESKTFDSTMTSIGIQNIRDVIAISLSLVMAGTGDLDSMRILRFLQGITGDNFHYGNYMVISMALGFLFLGGGQQAFRTDDLFSVAALITSIYPVFSSNNYKSGNDSVEVHLQALRHFWALGVQNRCLLVRDVDTRHPVKLNCLVELKNGEIRELSSPCLLPDLTLIKSIRTVEDKYYPIELAGNQLHNENFRKHLTLYVYRKAPIASQELPSLEESLKVNDNLDYKLLEFKSELKRLVGDVKHITIDQLWNLHLIFNYTNYYTTRRKTRPSSLMSEDGAGSNSWEMATSISGSGNEVNDKNDELNYVSVKFIENLKNELLTGVQEKFQ